MAKENILDHPAVLRILFHPRRESREESVTAARVVHLRVAPGIDLGGRLHVAEHDAPMILFWHGNGEIAADYDGIAGLYTGMGITFLVLDYRGYGVSDGKPTATALTADALAALERLPELFAESGIAPSRLYVMGRSMGSAAAIESAYSAPGGLAGLIIESGFAFTLPLVQRLGGFSPANTDEGQGFGNHEKIAHVAVPTLIIHGEEDRIIPVSDGRALYRQSPAVEKRLLTIADAGHNDLMLVGQRAYFEAIRRFVVGG